MTGSQEIELEQIIRLSAMDPELARALLDLVYEIERKAVAEHIGVIKAGLADATW